MLCSDWKWANEGNGLVGDQVEKVGTTITPIKKFDFLASCVVLKGEEVDYVLMSIFS